MKCKCVADVAAIVSEYTDGRVKEFQVYIKLEQGQAIAKIRDSREGELVGYVGLFDLGFGRDRGPQDSGRGCQGSPRALRRAPLAMKPERLYATSPTKRSRCKRMYALCVSVDYPGDFSLNGWHWRAISVRGP